MALNATAVSGQASSVIVTFGKFGFLAPHVRPVKQIQKERRVLRTLSSKASERPANDIKFLLAGCGAKHSPLSAKNENVCGQKLQ